MDTFLTDTPIVTYLARSGLLCDEPFVLVDVGCSGGIHKAWRAFGDDIIVWGFDPNMSECRRLQDIEPNQRARYVGGFAGLPPDHPFVIRRNGERWGNNPWSRLSVADATDRWEARSSTVRPADLRTANIWSDDEMVDESSIVVLPEFLREQGTEYVDFIKIDTDGEDLAILISLDDHLADLSVLGISVEVNFFGSARDTDQTFHNIDRLLKGRSYELFDLSLRRYSTSALPSKFIHSAPGPTMKGRLLQGDALYLRDVGNAAHWREAREWSAARIGKLCALFDMAGLSDCSAELLALFRKQLDVHIDVDSLLNELVPRGMWGSRRPYDKFLSLFAADDRLFYRRRSPAMQWARSMVRRLDERRGRAKQRA